MTWTLDLPCTAPPLRDNDRRHWADKHKRTAILRRDAYTIALAMNRAGKLPHGLHRARIVLVWRPAVNRRRDQLSIAPTLKPLVDGLVDYGLIPDDDTEHCELSCRIEPVAKPARLWLEITDLTEARSA